MRELPPDHLDMSLQFRLVPMLWDLWKPIDAGIHHLHMRVETFGDGFLDYGSSKGIEGFELAAFGAPRPRQSPRNSNLDTKRYAVAPAVEASGCESS